MGMWQVDGTNLRSIKRAFFLVLAGSLISSPTRIQFLSFFLHLSLLLSRGTTSNKRRNHFLFPHLFLSVAAEEDEESFFHFSPLPRLFSVFLSRGTTSKKEGEAIPFLHLFFPIWSRKNASKEGAFFIHFPPLFGRRVQLSSSPLCRGIAAAIGENQREGHWAVGCSGSLCILLEM